MPQQCLTRDGAGRARCFADEAESQRFSEQVAQRAACVYDRMLAADERLQWRDGSRQMPLDDILRKFAADLTAKGKVKSVQAAMDMNRRVRGGSVSVCVVEQPP